MKLLLLITMFIFGTHLCAQQKEEGPLKRFGFQAGVNIANMDFNKGYMATTAHSDAAWNTGVTLGFLIRIPLTKKLFLQPEYAYLQRNGVDKSITTNYTASYLSMPVLLNYRISSLFAVYAGPQGEILIHAKSSVNGVSTDITHDTEERSIGVTAGFEFQFNKNLFLSARYMRGLNHIGIGQRSNVKEFEYEVATVTAGIRF